MTEASDRVRTAFVAASDDFVSVATAITDQWDRPGLGEWTVRDLVGHTARALVTIESYVRPSDRVAAPAITSPAGYFAVALQGADHAAIAQRGREAAAALGPEPVASIRELADRVIGLLNQLPDDTLVDLPWGSIRLIDYLPTRMFELAVHTADLRAALDRDDAPPGDVVQAVFGILVAGYVARGDASDLLRALTGRVPTGSIKALL